MRLISWNVNGLRAAAKKGLPEWMDREAPDVLCLQETRAYPGQLPDEVRNIPGYHSYFSRPERKGYSGVGLYTKEEPVEVNHVFDEKFDPEGRLLAAHYADFVLYNVYFPNGKQSDERLQYKMDFYRSFLQTARDLVASGESVIICGDVNTAHREIDLARPAENQDVSGFLPQERQWIDQLLKAGFVDTFRMLHPQCEKYSFWDYRTRARERNVGWRLDYVFVSENMTDRVQEAFILDDVYGSDHCPVGIALKTDAKAKKQS